MPGTVSFSWQRNDLLAAVGVGLGYFAIAAFTVTFTRFDGGIAFVWVATALLVADLAFLPMSRWPLRLAVCWLASVMATIFFGFGLVGAVPLAFVNMGEAAVSVWLLRRIVPTVGEFRSTAEVAAFIAIAGLLGPAVAAVFGALFVNAITHTGFWPNWLTWFSAHGLGVMIFAPLLILMRGGEAVDMTRGVPRRQIGEAVGLLTALAITTAFVFSQTRFPLLFLPFLPMMIAVFRLGRFGAVGSSAIVALIGTAFTIKGYGPVSLVATIGLRAQFLQFYLATAVLMVLPAAAELKRRKNMFVALQQTSALQQLILDRTSDIVMRLEIDGTIAYVSPSIQMVGGFAPAQLIGRNSHDLIHRDDVAAVIQAHQRALASPRETFMVEYRAELEDGRLGWFETHTRATVDESDRPTGAVSVIREIGRRKAMEASLEHSALTDSLTGLSNRRAFDSAMKRAFGAESHGGPIGCIALFDLDNFKGINDSFGHANGDIVLQKFAEVAREAVRTNDLVARFGGEEFVVFLDGASTDQARTVCERIRTRFETLVIQTVEGRRIAATVSAGLADMHTGASIEHTLKQADTALYRSKSEGRNRLTLAA